MTDEKELSKEALGVAFHITETKPPHSYVARIARALDAWGEALLKRQADSDDTRLEEEIEEREGWQRRYVDEKAAHAATRAELEATRKELDSAKAQSDFYRDNGRLAIEQRAELRAELESLRVDSGHWKEIAKELEATRRNHGEALRDIETLRRELESLRKPLEGELAEALKRLRWSGCRKDSPFYEPAVEAAYALVEAALRAKGEPTFGELQRWLDVAGPSTEIRVSRSFGGTRGYVVLVEEDDGSVPVDRIEAPTLAGAFEKLSALASKEMGSRAKGEPQAAEPPRFEPYHFVKAEPPAKCDCAFADNADRLHHELRCPAVEPPDPRSIVVGEPIRMSAVTVNCAREGFGRQPGCVCHQEEGDSPCPRHDCPHGESYSDCAQCSPAAPAPELPAIGDKVRHLKSGKTGTIARASDYNPSKWVIAADKAFRGSDGCFADGFEAASNELELVQDAPKESSK